MHAHHQLVAHLNRGLESGLSGADYEVLAVLSGHDGELRNLVSEFVANGRRADARRCRLSAGLPAETMD